ncbi:MAG: c-type cytochrome domain-containing protein [Bryobacteraceae bacterium]
MRPLGLILLLPLTLPAQDFVKDVAPIFASNCLGCHAGNVKMGGLDLDTTEGIRKGGHNGTVLVPGKSAESRLYLMVAGKAQPAMPLSGKSLAAGDIETIRKWIDAGAKPPAPGTFTSITALSHSGLPEIKPLKPVKAQIGSLVWHPQGKLLALGGFREVTLHDPATNQPVATLSGHAEAVRALAFSPDGRLLAAAGGLPARKGEVKIWDVERRVELQTIAGHDDCIYAVAFSPDGKMVATSSYDKLIKLWDAATGKEIRTLKDHIDAVYALAFTPDGRKLVSAAADRTVKIWDPATGERLYTLGEPLDGLNALALDPSGKMVAAGGLDKTIRVWSLDEKSGTLLASLIAHEDAILGLSWSPDGKVLLSAAADRTIKAFKPEDLTEIKTFAGQPDWVMALEFSPDGKTVAAGRFDGSLALIPLADILTRGMQRAAVEAQ